MNLNYCLFFSCGRPSVLRREETAEVGACAALTLFLQHILFDAYTLLTKTVVLLAAAWSSTKLDCLLVMDVDLSHEVVFAKLS